MYDELVKRLRTAKAVVFKSEDVELLTEAADAIESLSEDNAALNGTIENLLEQIKDLGKPRWISVEERPPKAGQRVLLYNGEDIATGYMHSDKRFTLNASNYPSRPTHWMPRPEPPKEES